MSQELVKELEDVTLELINTLSTFTPGQLNTVPLGGGWAPGQVADHLFKSDYIILKALYGESRRTQRPPDKHAAGLRETLLDFTAKFKSPESILPAENTSFDKEGLLLSLEATRARMKEVPNKFDVAEKCLNIDEPALRGLTRIELLTFVIVHTKRHIHQLKEMKIPHHEWQGIPKLTAS